MRVHQETPRFEVKIPPKMCGGVASHLGFSLGFKSLAVEVFQKQNNILEDSAYPKDPQDPPMEGALNLYDAGVFRSSK